MKTHIIIALLTLVGAIAAYDAFLCPHLNMERVDFDRSIVQFKEEAEYFETPSALYMFVKKHEFEILKLKEEQECCVRDFLGMAKFSQKHPIVTKMSLCEPDKRQAIMYTYDHTKTAKDESIIVLNMNRQRHQLCLAWKQFAEFSKATYPEPNFYHFYSFYCIDCKWFPHIEEQQSMMDSFYVKKFRDKGGWNTEEWAKKFGH